MNKLSAFAKSLVAVAAVAAAAAASATPIIGTANLSFGLVRVTLGNIDWNAPINTPPNAVATYGTFQTFQGANTGSFALPAFAGTTQGLLHDLSSNPLDGNYVPVGPGLTAKFLSFNAAPGWQFTETNLAAGSFPATPYILTEQGGNVSATISASGTVCDTGGDNVCNLGDSISKWTGIFSAQYTNSTIASLQAILLGGGALANNTWSGTLEATRIPEPASLALVGLALAGIGLVSRRTKKSV